MFECTCSGLRLPGRFPGPCLRGRGGGGRPFDGDPGWSLIRWHWRRVALPPPCARTGLRQWLQLYGHKNTPLGMTTPEGVMSASHGLRFREALRFVLHAVLHRSGRSSTGCWAHQLDDIYHQILHRQPRRRRLGLQVRDAGAMHGILCPQPSLVTSPTQGTQWGFIRRRRPQHLGRALRQPTTATCPPQAASPPQPSCRASWGNPRELILC